MKRTSCGLCHTVITNLTVKKSDIVIIEDININLTCGELTSIVGPNGAGKTTLLKALLGEIKHSGKLKYLNSAGQETDKPGIGYVPQHINFDRYAPISVYDLFAASLSRFPVCFRKSNKINNLIKNSLSKVNVEYAINRRLGELSGGELQKVLLALALEPVPEILLLDEPVSGVDKKGMELFYDMVSELRRNYDLTVLLVSHDLPLIAKYADRVILLNKKVLCEGTPKEVFSSPDFISTFGDYNIHF